jgi:bifunctional non-homologous end joining protein LigD
MGSAGEAESRGLDEYRRKRDFRTTSEPDGSRESPEAQARFVVHEHHATRLHWDLRLERDGTLASWAVPNGIPEDPKHNRKAIHVEDHPLSYLDFEGTIAPGNYGAGEVTVWDSGTYTCEKWAPREILLDFHGGRLRGRYALFRAGPGEKDWMIHRMDPPLDPTAEEIPEFIGPMLAKPSTLPAREAEWAFEVKWDGVRAIAHSQPGRIQLWSRSRNDITAAYPELRALNRALGSHSAILDGEIVAFDDAGRPSFEALQSRMHLRGEAAVRRRAQVTPTTYVLFDLLWLDGHSLLGLPYVERRDRLTDLKLDGERWCTPESHVGEGMALLQATREQDIEGVIAKRLDSRYIPGRRSDSWLKIKHSYRQEVVIGGWTEGKGSRASRIGALQVGIYELDELRYAGRVGTGFGALELERLGVLLGPLERSGSPFAGRQPPRGAHFAEPRLVCEVEFSQWTKGGLLRQASYKGLREDKPATEVVRERVEPPPVDPAVKRGKAGRGKAKHGEAGGGGAARGSGTRDEVPSGRASVQALVDAGRRVRGGVEVELEGRMLKLTNLDKPLYPKPGFTKADLIGYYLTVAPVLLPHLLGRPLTLKRYPDGVDAEHFYEKQCPGHRPEWVQTVSVWSESNGRAIDYCLCQDLPTLLWLANLAAVELHPSLSLARPLECPRTLVFDLDPGRPASIVECCRVALVLREMFAELGMLAFAKTSGSKGLQVYVPLNDDEIAYAQTKPFAHAVADVLEQRHPELVLSSMARARRSGKVLVDWSQNDEHKTTVSVYSLRATPRPQVSTPVDWSEVEQCATARRALLTFSAEEVLRRIAEHGDLFAEVLSRRQTLPALGDGS